MAGEVSKNGDLLEPARRERELAGLRRGNEKLRKRIHDLKDEIRELRCLGGVSELLDKRYIPVDDLFRKIIKHIPSGFRYPKRIHVRIVADGKSYMTPGFCETKWKLSRQLVAGTRDIGELSVFRSCGKALEGKDPFTKKEKGIVERTAELLGRFTDHRRTEEILRKYQDKLEIQMIETNEELHREIEMRKKTEKALRESEQKHRTVLEAAPDPVMVRSMKGRITYINPAFTKIFGWTLEEITDREIDFMPDETLPETEMIFAKINNHQSFSGIETHRIARDGRRIEVSVSASFFHGDNSEPDSCVLTLQDITQRKKTENEIAFIAYHDVLTGLPNRKSFYRKLEDKLNQSRRSADMKWALLFLDLDKFKFVNDTLGHDAGDELLKITADRLRNSIRKTDYIFRLGGDEFTIILNNLYKDLDVANVALKIRRAVAQPCNVKAHELYTTVSIGISIYPYDGNDVETLVKNADLAMYVAKDERDGYRFFTEDMNLQALERMKLGNSLRNALQRNEFALHYQPLVDGNKRIMGVEALLRWMHPELGLLNPGKFMRLAEETGFIIPIGEWALRSACTQIIKWQEMGYNDLYVTVNLSTRQFNEEDLVDTVEQVLHDTGLPGKYLKLEVTESGIMEDPEKAVSKMKSLRSRGITFSIDDFGTGYSSLSYMKRFPVDTLKIDRSFVADSMTNQDDREIIKTIIAMASNLGIATLAEGVENEEQIEFLARQGCGMMQGYYFGRPMTADTFEECLRDENLKK